jgi:hypothetical protein
MLTLDQMQSRLNLMTYKPGWEMHITQGAFEGPHLQIIATLEDSVEKGKISTFDVHSSIPPMLSQQQFDLYILDRLMRIETHEAREWLQIDNKALFYPHCNHADRDEIKYYNEYQRENGLI